MHSREFKKGQAMSSPLSDRTKQRRRLLKAVAGVPAIVVLPAGAQSAAASVTCITRGVDNNPAPMDPVDAPDIWVREKVTDASGNVSYVLAPDPVDGQPVAYASCWNSVVTSPQAGSDNVLIS